MRCERPVRLDSTVCAERLSSIARLSSDSSTGSNDCASSRVKVFIKVVLNRYRIRRKGESGNGDKPASASRLFFLCIVEIYRSDIRIYYLDTKFRPPRNLGMRCGVRARTDPVVQIVSLATGENLEGGFLILRITGRGSEQGLVIDHQASPPILIKRSGAQRISGAPLEIRLVDPAGWIAV